ncbi:hypothetical protein U1Q18_051738 [Sarracenia purpurea var. burkii]
MVEVILSLANAAVGALMAVELEPPFDEPGDSFAASEDDEVGAEVVGGRFEVRERELREGWDSRGGDHVGFAKGREVVDGVWALLLVLMIIFWVRLCYQWRYTAAHG